MIVVALIVAVLLCGSGTASWWRTCGIQPMVATLILMIAGRGIAQLITNSIKIIIFNDAFAYIGNGFVVLPVSLFIVAALFIGIVAADAPDGARAVRGIGRHQLRASFYAASTRSGSSCSRTRSAASAPASPGLIAVSSIRTSDANQIGLYTELDAILAVVIGGTVLGAGGRFSLLGSVDRRAS